MDKQLELREYVLGEDEEFGLKAISIVDNPAIGEAFIMLAEQKQIHLAKVEDEQVLVGALLIPDQRIYRSDESGEYEMFVSGDTIKELSHRFMRQEFQNQITLQHEEQLINIGVREIWLVADPKKDKSAVYGFNYPVGTLMASVKVEDSKQWESLKDSDVKGFSVEMMLAPKDKKELSAIETLNQLLENQ